METVTLTDILLDPQDEHLRDSLRFTVYKGTDVRRTRIVVYTGNGLLSRKLLGVTNPEIAVDHINHNTLDNRRQNLRAVTHNQNHANRRGRLVSTSKYKGVSVRKKNSNRQSHWRATIGVTCNTSVLKSGTIELGYFLTEVEAAIAYNQTAREWHGEFAYLNEITYADIDEVLDVYRARDSVKSGKAIRNPPTR